MPPSRNPKQAAKLIMKIAINIASNIRNGRKYFGFCITILA